jgi:hypothetical protein
MPLTRYKNSERQLAAQIPPKEFYSCMTRAGNGRLGWRLLSKSRIWRKVVSQRQPDREVQRDADRDYRELRPFVGPRVEQIGLCAGLCVGANAEHMHQ